MHEPLSTKWTHVRESQDPKTGWDWRGHPVHPCLQAGLINQLGRTAGESFITVWGGQNTTHNRGLPGHRRALQRTICMCLFWLSLLKSHSQGQGHGQLRAAHRNVRNALGSRNVLRNTQENILNHLVQIHTSPRSQMRRRISSPLSTSSCE